MKTLHTIFSIFAKHNMAKFLTILTILFTLGVGSMWGETIDFESTTATYSNWTFTNMTSKQSGDITAKGGSYYGTTGGKATASIQTKKKIASPSSLSCYISRQSNNTTSSTWYIQTSTNGSSWTNVKTQSATSMNKGAWVEFTADLSSYTDVYVRIYYSGSTAIRNIDNLVLTEAAATPTVYYDVNWIVNESNYTVGSPTTSVAEGGNVTILPTNPTLDCSGRKFVGWSNQEVTNGQQPSTLFTTAATSPAITENTTFYAVFATGGGSVSTSYKFTITPNDFNTTSYAANNNEKTATATATDGSGSTVSVKWTSNQVMKQSSNMQWQKSAGYIYNSTDLGTITSVTVTSSAGTFTTYYGTTSQPSSGTKGDGKGYFKTSVGSVTGQTTKVEVVFTKSSGSAPTYSDYTTSCSTETTYSVKLTQPSNGSISATPYENILENKTVELTANPDSGYKLSAWTVVRNDNSQSVTVSNNQFTMPASDVTVSATFDAIPQLNKPTNLLVSNLDCDGATLSWDAVTGATSYYVTYTPSTSGGISAGNNTTSLSNLKPGTQYTWSVQAKGDGTNYLDSEKATETFTTHYSITYNTNGGSSVVDGCGTALPNPLPIPTKNHYEFDGWYTDNGLTTKAEASAAIGQNTTLYAKWTADTYKITLNPQDGTLKDKSGNVQPTIVIDYVYGATGAPLTDYYSTVEKSGYQFKGWYNATSGGSKWTTTSSATQDVTLYAQWTKIHTITWNVAGDESNTTTVLDREKVVLPSAPKSCSDEYTTFVGWYTQAAGEESNPSAAPLGTQITADTKPNDDVTYYAVWADGSSEDREELKTTLDFSSNVDWKIPSGSGNKTITENQYSNGTYTIKLAGSTNNGYYYNSNQVLLGKNGAYLELPAFDFKVSKIVSTTPTGTVSGAVTWNVFTGEIPVSNPLTGCTSGGTFEIDKDYQTEGTIYTIKVTNANNLQIKKLEIYGPIAGATGYISTCCANSINITKGAEKNGTFNVTPLGEIASCDGVTVAVTPTPASHYHVKSVTATNPSTAGSAQVVDNGDGTWNVTYEENSKGDTKIDVTFEEDRKFDVTWYVNGVALTGVELGEASTKVYENDKVEKIPDNPAPPCGGMFVGWTVAEMDVDDTDEPNELYTQQSEFPDATDSQTFYAVFADYEE